MEVAVRSTLTHVTNRKATKRMCTYSTFGVNRSSTECFELNSAICQKHTQILPRCQNEHYITSISLHTLQCYSLCGHSPSSCSACRCPIEPSTRPETRQNLPLHVESCKQRRKVNILEAITCCFIVYEKSYQAFTSSATPRKEASSSIPSILITVLSTSKQTASASRQISLDFSSVIFETSIRAILKLVLILSNKREPGCIYVLRGTDTAILSVVSAWFWENQQLPCPFYHRLHMTSHGATFARAGHARGRLCFIA